MKRILIADDHSIVRKAMRWLLTEKYLNIQVDECTNGEQALELVSLHAYDLLIVDLVIPHTNTGAILEKILTDRPGTRILIFSMVAEAIFAARYFQIGVLGFLSKECSEKDIETAIDAVLNNKKYISTALGKLFTVSDLYYKSANPFEGLTAREKQIARLLITGKSINEIRYALNIQNSTLGSHKYRIFEKMRINNVIDLKEIAGLYDFS